MASAAPDLLPPIVMTFAASDPTSGAGLQADLLTLASMGCHPLSVVTALTIQDTAGVEDVLPIDAEWVADQARALLEDMPVAAFKLGMLGSAEVVSVIAEILADPALVPPGVVSFAFGGAGSLLDHLDWQDSFQSAASGTTWPIGRGLASAGRSMSSRFYAKLAGRTEKESIS